MSKKVQNQEEVVVAEAVSKTEKFFEENGKKVVIALVALLLLVAGGYAYKYLVMDKNETAAAELIVAAQAKNLRPILYLFLILTSYIKLCTQKLDILLGTESLTSSHNKQICRFIYAHNERSSFDESQY